jgi:hypothetical protein
MSTTTPTNKYQIFCLSFNNPERKENMRRRFHEAGFDNCIFNDGVSFHDPRIDGRDICAGTKRIWSCMYGHLDMIYDFYYNTDKEFGIFCEDDIYIRKNFKIYLPRIMQDYKKNNLDVLLLGYLVTHRITQHHSQYTLTDNIYHNYVLKYYHFPDHIWGTQMYMFSRTSAKKILDKYVHDSNYADRALTDTNMTPFCADWSLTKDGHCALITPIMVVEDNCCHYDDYNQRIFHESCHTSHFVEEEFIV